MNETLDDDLRTMMRTAVANAPEAPTVAELIDPQITADHEQSRAHVRLVGLAAAVLVVAMVAALALRTTARDAEISDAPSAAYLDAFYLPFYLPEGWTVIRMDRTPAGGDLQLSDAAMFATSDGLSDVGIVNRSPSAEYEDSVGTEPPSSIAAMTAPTLLPDATWDESSRWLTWSAGGDDYTVQVRSGQEAAARSLGAAIQTAADTGRSFDVDLASGWYKADEQFAGSTPATGTNGVEIADQRGRIVRLTIQRTNGLFDIAVWTPVVGEPVYREPTYDGRPAGFGRLIDGYLVTATPNTADAVGAALVVLRSIGAVSAADWEAATPDHEQSIREAATLARFALLDHTVTLHSEGPWRGVCVDRADEASGCILATIGDDGTLAQVAPNTGIRLSDGSWVAVGSIPADDEMCAGDDLAGARAAAAPYGSQQIVLLVPGDQTQSFACAPGDGQQPFIAMPPTP